jgi:hypothetical protein
MKSLLSLAILILMLSSCNANAGCLTVYSENDDVIATVTFDASQEKLSARYYRESDNTYVKKMLAEVQSQKSVILAASRYQVTQNPEDKLPENANPEFDHKSGLPSLPSYSSEFLFSDPYFLDALSLLFHSEGIKAQIQACN